MIKINQEIRKGKAFSREEVKAFAELSGDNNSIHLHDTAAQACGFKGAIVHGALVVAHMSSLLANDLPGAGTIILSQQFTYNSPVYLENTVIFKIVVVGIDDTKSRVRAYLDTSVFYKNERIIDGYTKVLLPKEPA